MMENIISYKVSIVIKPLLNSGMEVRIFEALLENKVKE